MRVLHVVQELKTGGAERIVLALAAGAERAGHAVAVASGSGELAADVESWFPLPVVSRRATRIPAAVRALEHARRTFHPTLLHVHNPTMALVAGIVAARGHRLPGLVSVHGVPDDDYGRAALLLRLAGLPVIACGADVREVLVGAHVRVLATVANGVQPAPAPADRRVLYAEWGLAPEHALVLAVGRLVAQKNHALALEALAHVPDAALVLVGEGELREELEQRARALRIADRVVFAGRRSDARALIGAADAVVLPSSWEGLPLVALETLAAGTPLVATCVRGLRELLTDENAVVVPPDDGEALAEGLRRVLRDNGLRRRLRAGALRTAAEHDEETMVDRYLQLYTELAA
jgi:glycosyltransferase involved in cell wall biosynthesis